MIKIWCINAWKQRKLLDNMCDVLDYRGKSPIKFGMEWGNSGYLVLSALNVKNGYIDKDIEAKYGSQQLFEKWMGNRRLEKGDVVFTTEAPLGNVAQIPDNKGYILNQRAVAFKVKQNKMDKNFLAQLLRSPLFQSRLQANASGGTAKGIGMKEFAKMTSQMPKNIEEQQKIGDFFKQLDNTIALHQRKLEALKEMKKGFLRQFFPQCGEKIPRVRFANFHDDWDLRKVSEITKFHKQGFYTKESYENNKKYYLLRGTEMKSNRLILKNTPKIDATEKDYNDYKVKKGDFLIVRSGTVGTYGIVQDDIEAIFGSYLINFRFDMQLVTNEFFGLFYQSNLFKNQLNKIIQQSSNININAENIKSTTLTLPSINEQQKIDSFFKQLDDTIIFHQNKLAQLTTLKKAYLQNMFI